MVLLIDVVFVFFLWFFLFYLLSFSFSGGCFSDSDVSIEM